MALAKKVQISRRLGPTAQSRPTVLDATDWWAFSLGIAACAVALLIFAADEDGAKAAAVLVAASVLIAGVLQFKKQRESTRIKPAD